MARFPTPAREGHFWAKLKLHDNPDLNSVNWEVVQVFENGGDPKGPEFHMASVPGVQGSQPLDYFVWGPPVHKPAELSR